jgi:predicted aspartyl protease
MSATVSTLCAETRCPGNVASVPLKIINGHQILLAVSINHAGPYNFLLDTGSQVTIVDLSLASELHLSLRGSANLVSAAGSKTAASVAQVDLLETGSHANANQTVLAYDFQKVNSAIHPIRGILGEDFLGRFDILIDNAHSMLCLDDSAAMRANVKGPHIALEATAQSLDGQSSPSEFIVAARLSNARRPIRLKLDSASDVSVLYNIRQFMTRAPFSTTSMQETQVDGAQRAFAVLPPQEVMIGPLNLPEVSFVIPPGSETGLDMAEDGVLPTGLFRRVFIDHVNHFAVLEPW